MSGVSGSAVLPVPEIPEPAVGSGRSIVELYSKPPREVPGSISGHRFREDLYILLLYGIADGAQSIGGRQGDRIQSGILVSDRRVGGGGSSRCSSFKCPVPGYRQSGGLISKRNPGSGAPLLSVCGKGGLHRHFHHDELLESNGATPTAGGQGNFIKAVGGVRMGGRSKVAEGTVAEIPLKILGVSRSIVEINRQPVYHNGKGGNRLGLDDDIIIHDNGIVASGIRDGKDHIVNTRSIIGNCGKETAGSCRRPSGKFPADKVYLAGGEIAEIDGQRSASAGGASRQGGNRWVDDAAASAEAAWYAGQCIDKRIDPRKGGARPRV